MIQAERNTNFQQSEIFSWKRFAAVTVFIGGFGFYLQNEKNQREQKKKEEEEAKRKRILEEGEDKLEANLSAMGGPFTLIDENGILRTQEDFEDKFLLIYFGYTFCPDICPSELKKMAEAIDLVEKEEDLKKLREIIQPIFISVDPERDSLEQIKKYTKEFHPRLLGMTGDEAQLKKMTKQYGVYVKKENYQDADALKKPELILQAPLQEKGKQNEEDKGKNQEKTPDDYLVDHSIFTFLVAPNNKLVDYYGHDIEQKVMAKAIARRIRTWQKLNSSKITSYGVS